jgi:phosphoribosylamine--glycine ligase
MKILVLGHTASSNFMIQLLLKNPKINTLYHAGASDTAEPTSIYIPLQFGNFEHAEAREKLLEFIKKNNLDLIVGLYHRWQIWRDLQTLISKLEIPAFLPSYQIGMLEWSKLLSKKLFADAGVPTANYSHYSIRNLYSIIDTIDRPFVLKFEQDWRAGEQTIVVTDDNYSDVIYLLLHEPNQDQICIIEDYIEGTQEFSYHAICNTVDWKYLGSARDYKKRYENDQGHNTVGMGSYGLVENINPIIHSYVDKILAQLKLQKIDYTGFMYLGIKIDNNGTPWVLELNTRSGDPEIQSILTLVKNDLLDLIIASINQVAFPPIETISKSAVTVRIVNKEYNTREKTTSIEPVLNSSSDILVYYNSTRELLHSTLTAVDDTRIKAADKIYNFLKTIDMGDYTYRKDIGYLD